jgi:hypothetical protein
MSLLKTYSTQELERDFRNLRVSPIAAFSSRAGKKLCNSFFQGVRLSTPANNITHLSTLEFYNTPEGKKRIDDFHEKHGKSHIQNSAQFYCKTPAQFPPAVWMGFFRCRVDRLFVPFGGWGNSALAGSLVAGHTILCDPNPDLQLPYHGLSSWLRGRSGVGTFQLLQTKCEDVIDDVLRFFRPQFSFSSPPFYKRGVLQEKYKYTEASKSVFYTTCLLPLIGKLRSAGVPNIMHLPGDMIEDVVAAGFEVQMRWAMPKFGYAKGQNEFILL